MVCAKIMLMDLEIVSSLEDKKRLLLEDHQEDEFNFLVHIQHQFREKMREGIRRTPRLKKTISKIMEIFSTHVEM